MKNLTKLIELIEWFHWTADAFESAEDLYEYTTYDDELSEATYEECEQAFN